MAYFPDDMPRPEPDWDDRDFWKNCADRHLRFQACADCGAVRHPPGPICPACHATGVTWLDAPSEGEVYSFNVVHYVSHVAVGTRVPYVGAVIEFPAIPGVRLISNVTDCDPAGVRIGMAVRLWWDDIGGEMHVPRFRPVDPPASGTKTAP